MCVSSLLNKPTVPNSLNRTAHTRRRRSKEKTAKKTPPSPPPPQSPGSQMRNSFHSCIVCLVPLAYSIVVCRSRERAASSARRRLAVGAASFCVCSYSIEQPTAPTCRNKAVKNFTWQRWRVRADIHSRERGRRSCTPPHSSGSLPAPAGRPLTPPRRSARELLEAELRFHSIVSRLRFVNGWRY